MPTSVPGAADCPRCTPEAPCYRCRWATVEKTGCETCTDDVAFIHGCWRDRGGNQLCAGADHRPHIPQKIPDKPLA